MQELKYIYAREIKNKLDTFWFDFNKIHKAIEEHKENNKKYEGFNIKEKVLNPSFDFINEARLVAFLNQEVSFISQNIDQLNEEFKKL